MVYDKEIDIQKVLNFVDKCSDQTRVYIGTDSERHKVEGVWVADYISVVVVHIDGCRGGKIFGCVNREVDYDKNKHKPAMRMMTEVRKSCELYNKVFDALTVKPEIALNMEIHLDINRMKEHGSSVVIDEALGYVRGVCGIEAKAKPDAWSASYCADRFKEIMHLEKASV